MMKNKFITFLFNKTIIKFVPKLQKELLYILKNAEKIKNKKSLRQIIIYIVYHFDYPHLVLKNIENNKYENNFTIYPKIKNYSKKLSKIKFYINCNGMYNGMEIIEIENKPVIDFIKEKILEYNNPQFKNINLFPNLFYNLRTIVNHYKICDITLQNNNHINPKKLKKLKPKYLSTKYSKYLINYINTKNKTFDKILYIKVGSFSYPFTEEENKYLNKKLKTIESWCRIKNRNTIFDIRGNGGGCQEACYPFIKAIFGNDVLQLIKQKKQLNGKEIVKNGNKIKLNNINITEKVDQIKQNQNKFNGKLFVLMNYTSGSMSIICISWLKYLQKRFNIDMIFIGTDIYYQRGLSNSDIEYKMKKYNLHITGPSRYICKRGIKDMNVIFKPMYYYMNEKYLEDNQYPEKNIPIDFIVSLS